jgi:hypothetical protein
LSKYRYFLDDGRIRICMNNYGSGPKNIRLRVRNTACVFPGWGLAELHYPMYPYAVIYEQDLHCRKIRKYEIYKCRPYKDEEEDNEGERPAVDDVSDGQEKTVLLEEQVGSN